MLEAEPLWVPSFSILKDSYNTAACETIWEPYLEGEWTTNQ